MHSVRQQFSEMAGIIGGVGPEATNYFIGLLTKFGSKNAKKDQDYPPYLLFNNPQIPDRTAHLLYSHESPVPELIRTGKILKEAGATFLVIPCNTAHAYVREVEQAVGLRVLNMVEEVSKYIVMAYGENITVGLLATDGTLKSQIYQNTFKRVAPNIRVLTPNPATQKQVMSAIYSIKAKSVTHESSTLLRGAAQKLVLQGADVVILGCTEIPLAMPINSTAYTVVDPMEILAKKVVHRALVSRISQLKSPHYALYVDETP